MANPVAEVAAVRRDAGRTRDRDGLVVELLARVDWLLLAGIAGLLAFGLWALAGITRYDITGDPRYYLRNQAMFAAVGVSGFVIAAAISPATYARFWRYVYAGAIGALLVVPLAGETVGGATRWIDVGAFRFQPSEFGKPLIALVLAGFLIERGRAIKEARTVVLTLLVAAPLILLVYRQPDLGTALVYAAGLAAALFVAGTPWKQLLVLGMSALILALSVVWAIPYLTGHEVLRPYQKDRLIGFLHPSDDPLAPTYNVNQSVTAIASGGIRGRGELGSARSWRERSSACSCSRLRSMWA
jgi:rod shape determining protein RodA